MPRAAPLIAALIICCSCSTTKQHNTAPLATPQAAPVAADQPAPCSLFTPAEAEQIMGVPMKLVTGHGDKVCMYQEAQPAQGNSDIARVSLTLNVRASSAEENRAWGNIKVLRRLKAGKKNIAPLSGIGDEAWFDGYIKNGKLGTGGVLVRKGRSDFMLESALLAYRASADTMKAIAGKIAGQLP